MSRPTLDFVSHNPSASQTILLLHGGFSSSKEFTFILPHLSSYHLLIPTLPSHGTSTSHSIPFTFSTTAALLADLISKHAHNGVAHVVGVSLGGYNALNLAATYPSLVQSIFVTGCGKIFTFTSSVMTGIIIPFIFLPLVWLPPSWYNSLQGRMGVIVPPGWQADQRAAAGFALGFRLGWASATEFGEETVRRVEARTLLIAGGKGDFVESTTKMGELLRKGNAESRAVIVRDAVHVWDMQFPELFAKCVEAWIEEGELPVEMERL